MADDVIGATIVSHDGVENRRMRVGVELVYLFPNGTANISTWALNVGGATSSKNNTYSVGMVYTPATHTWSVETPAGTPITNLRPLIADITDAWVRLKLLIDFDIGVLTDAWCNSSRLVPDFVRLSGGAAGLTDVLTIQHSLQSLGGGASSVTVGSLIVTDEGDGF